MTVGDLRLCLNVSASFRSGCSMAGDNLTYAAATADVAVAVAVAVLSLC